MAFRLVFSRKYIFGEAALCLSVFLSAHAFSMMNTVFAAVTNDKESAKSSYPPLIRA